MTLDQIKLRDAILALPDRQRAAFLLRRYDGMSHTNIGFTLGCSAEEARQAVVDAITALAPSLGDDHEKD